MKPVIIVGAGFSGLTLAYALRQLDVPVRIFESASGPGGLIATKKSNYGLIETAANAMLADAEVERLFHELGLEFAVPERSRRKRYIFWAKPRRWPVGLWTTLKLIRVPIFRFLTIDHVRPHAGESVAGWCERVINEKFLKRVLAPALQGVFAGDVDKMSASIAIGNMFKKHRRGRRRGSIAPRRGMGDLIRALTEDLKNRGVEIEYGVSYKLTERPEQPTVVCTSVWAAAQIVSGYDPELAGSLAMCECLPLITVTAFFEPHRKDLQGFGCLFPESQGFHSLGVLFNDCIFAGRSNVRSETWILGGSKNMGVADLSDDDIKRQILHDRGKIVFERSDVKEWNITRWPQALPHYTVAWEDTLRRLKVNRPLFLHGNYLGQMGLSRIQHRSTALAKQLKDLYVS